MNIKDKITRLSFEEAKKMCQTFEYALVYEISTMHFDKTAKVLPMVLWEECTEAYFFGQKGQLHIFQGEEDMEAVVFSEDDQMKTIDMEYVLADRFLKVGKTVVKREYLETDSDGQIYTAYTRLVEIR